MLAKQLANNFRREVLGETRNLMICIKAAHRVPKCVDAVPHHLFKEIANCLDLYHGEFMLLIGSGTLMLRDNQMEIWAPDSQRSKRQQDLLAYAKLFRRFALNGEFVLRIPMEGGVACTPMRLGADMKIEDLKAIAATATGIRTENQRMSHLGHVLTTGTLNEHGVMPGACVIATDIM